MSETDHLVAPERVARIEKRMETYVHSARRLVVNVMGPDAGHDNVMVIATLAAAMANLETAEILASVEDRIADILDKKGT